MLRLSLIVLLVQTSRTAYVTESPSLAERFDKLYERLEKITISPPETNSLSRDNAEDRLYAKLDKLNSINPDTFSDDEEEILAALEQWGVSDMQLSGIVADMQSLKQYTVDKLERDEEYNDQEWVDDETDLEYPMDGNDEYDGDDEIEHGTPSPFVKGSDPSTQVISAESSIVATNARPRILDDSGLSPSEHEAVRRAALSNMAVVLRTGICQTPQPRWLPVRQLAPAADTVYMPPYVQLHRCARDSGCCHSESDFCAPVDGRHVIIPFYLNKPDGNYTVARMVFFNHTKCACVNRQTLTAMRATRGRHLIDRETNDEQSWRNPTEEPILERDEQISSSEKSSTDAPPQLRRCTCPTMFAKRITASGSCTCVCDWHDLAKRRGCLFLAKGREHFGLRDRVCVLRGECNFPSCEYGAYEKETGQCPVRKFRRIRYQRKLHAPRMV